MSIAADDPRHGTMNAYGNLNCRCSACVEAARVYRVEKDHLSYKREWSHRTGRSKPLDVHLAEIEPEHGTESRYTNRGCRCQECRAAASEAKRQRRLRSRVPCVSCGTLVDSINRRDSDKAFECQSCSRERIVKELARDGRRWKKAAA